MTPARETALDDGAPITFVGRHLSRSFEKRFVEIASGAERPYDAAEWHDAIVVVEAGEVEVEGLHGARRAFGPGDMLCLDRFPCRLLRNRGTEPVILSVVARRREPH